MRRCCIFQLLERNEKVSRIRGAALDAPNSDPMAFRIAITGHVNGLEDDGRGLVQCTLESTHQDDLQLSVDEVQDVESLASVAESQKRAGPSEGLDELTALGHEQARRHVLIEQ